MLAGAGLVHLGDMIAAGVSGDLAYVVMIEHTTASIGGADPKPYSLRVTQVFRREGGEWKVVSRYTPSVRLLGVLGRRRLRCRRTTAATSSR